MGRKPKDDPRVSLSRLVAGGTLPLLTSLAKGWKVSEGVAIDMAVQLAAIAESFGPATIRLKEDVKAARGDVLTRRSASIDHQVPLSRNGSNQQENKVPACKPCNHLKDSMDVETYRSFLLDRLPRGERIIFFGERV